MKILFLSNWFPYPPDNGARMRSFNLLRQLALRHEISILSFVRGRQVRAEDRDAMNAYCRVLGTVPYREFQPSSPRALRYLFSTRPRSVLETYSPQMARQLEKALDEYVFDLIVASEIGPGISTSPYVLELDGVPRVIEDLELSMIQSRIKAQRKWVGQWRHQLTWWKQQSYARGLLRRVSGCTVASEAEKRLVERIAPQDLPLAIVPNGVDVSVYTGDFGPPQPDTLVFSGALSYVANFEAMHFFLSEIFPLIKSRRPSVTLHITGRTEGVPLEKLPGRAGVVFTGYLDDIRPAIARSQVSVVPLRHGGGTRLKILEAMALGTPVVSTSQGAAGLEARPDQDILVADRPEDFAQAVLCLLGDEKLRAKLSSNGRQLVAERYSWQTCARNLELLLDKVVERRRGSDA